jgi:choline dehydrogenase
MGTPTDSAPAVVDEQLKVYGVEGLRIADASVFPTSPAAHLQAPAVVVAEKCAEMMKATYRK